jgi:hypothetical protein
MYETVCAQRINLFQENGNKTKEHIRYIWILRNWELCTPQSTTPLGMYVYICMYVCIMYVCMYNFPAEFFKANIHVMLHWYIMLLSHHNGIWRIKVFAMKNLERITFELYLLSLTLYRRKLNDIFKDLFRSAPKTHCSSVIKTNRLKLCEEKMSVFSDIHTKRMNILFGQKG